MGIRTQTLRTAVLRDRPPAGPVMRLRDRFELLVKLGSGGFGTVWEGFDMLLERAVAVKVLPVDGDAGDALREARATARLNHPAIVSLYEIVAEPDCIYMISELVHGSTLDELIRERLLSDRDAGRIGAALCEALAHAHSHGVVHRDVKPANVMVTDEWIDGVSGWRVQPAKLMDFGIASIVDREGGLGPHAGSRGYMSPEQEAGEPATPASDVYSLALVMFECFSGAPPGRGRRGRLARLRRDLSPELTRCVDRCLEDDPLLRPELGELASGLALALPSLSDDLNSRGLLARLRRPGRTSAHTSAPTSAPTSARSAVATGPEPSPGPVTPPRTATTWRMRLVCGLTAAAATALTLRATGLPITGPPVALLAALVLLLPRGGWAPAICAGAVALVIKGQDGSALVLLLAVFPAAAAAAIDRRPLAAAALWGAAAFLWVLALQAASGAAIVLAQPAALPSPAAVRGALPDALTALQLYADPAYAASLSLWAAASCVAARAWRRGARLPLWSLLTAAAIAGQLAIGSALHAMVPPVTLVCAPLAAGSVLLLAAAVGRRTGRVFSAK